MPKIIIKLDIEKDFWNWWEACNKTSHGVDWKKNISLELSEKLFNKSEEEAFALIAPHIKKMYVENNLQAKIAELQKYFDKKQDEIFATMEKLTMQKIYCDDFTCFLTTFPRFPYDYDKGYIWLSYRRDFDYQVSIFIHELLHFQYFAYYGERAWDYLGEEKYGYLKEAMTVILNEECGHLTSEKDDGYEIHKELRAQLLDIWKKTKRFDLFFEQALEVTKMIEIK